MDNIRTKPYRSLWTTRESTADDMQQISALFEEVFGQHMSPELWKWKYGAGRGHAMVAERNGKIIAHYGGVCRDVVRNKVVQPSIQCVDTMVKPSERGTLSRRGPYYLVAFEFLDRFVGYGRPFEFGFGFPNKRVMRVGEILGIQAPVGEIVEPVWPVIDRSDLQDRKMDLGLSEHRSIADRQWALMHSELQSFIVCVRDSAYIQYRYFDNPTYDYDVRLILKDSADIVGITVTRIEADRCLLLDLVGSVSRFPDLIRHLRYRASLLGCKELVGWITEPHLRQLGERSYHLHRPEVQIPTSVCTDGPDPDSLRNAWWLSAGDAEFK